MIPNSVNEVFLLYAKMIRLCAGTKLHSTPWKCVKSNGRICSSQPDFTLLRLESIEFARTVVGDTAIFYGDNLYWTSGDTFDWSIGGPDIASGGKLTIHAHNASKKKADPFPHFGSTTVTLRDTGEVRKPRIGEYVLTEGGYYLCKKPEVWSEECQIWKVVSYSK